LNTTHQSEARLGRIEDKLDTLAELTVINARMEEKLLGTIKAQLNLVERFNSLNRDIHGTDGVSPKLTRLSAIVGLSNLALGGLITFLLQQLLTTAG